MARLSAFYFGDHGPVWAATTNAAEKRMAPFRSKISGPCVRVRAPRGGWQPWQVHWRIYTGRAEMDERGT